MFDIAAPLEAALAAGQRAAVVTVTAVHGSAPRTVGSSMAVTAGGAVIGAISGGCVESEAHELAVAALEESPVSATSGVADAVVATLGLAEEDSLAAGLACGGHVDVEVTLVAPEDDDLRAHLRHAAAGEAAQWTLGSGHQLHHTAAPRLVIVGAVDYSAALATAARPLGYRITVVDARPAFATRARHADAHEVVVQWPADYLAGETLTQTDAICVLTHEERFDIPALVAALASGAGYVGAMGSRRTDQRRRALLSEAGVSDADLGRLRSPIGLDVGAVTPAETAVSIVAELVADSRRAQTSAHLADSAGPIHRADVIRSENAAHRESAPA